MSSQRKHIKFADAFYLNMGKTPARANDAYWSNGLYDWVSISDLPDGKYIQGTKEKISQKAVDETRIHLVKKGTVIMSFKLTIGKTAIAPFDLYTNEAIMAFEPKDGIEASAEFLYYYLRNYKWSGNRAVMGATINKEVISNSYADLPSLSEQQSIVRELDAISDVIAAKNAQLRELDALAQALFYDIFGDPITNPKGWEIKPFGDILSYIKNGANIKQTKGAGGIPITRIETLSGGVFNRDRLGYADITDESKYKAFYLESGDLLMSHINSKTYIGRTVMYEKEGGETIIHGMNLLRLKTIREIVDPMYVCFYCKTDTFKANVVNIRKDAVNQSSICISDIVRIPIMCPPLDLQQAFAAKIQAIEAQKTTLRQSIAEFESLLAQRMDYHFN